MKLPTEYIDYISNGGITEGETDYDTCNYFILEPLDQVEKMNTDLSISEFIPGHIAFASDGGNEIYTFDNTGSVYLFPMVGMELESSVKLAETWNEFCEHIQE